MIRINQIKIPVTAEKGALTDTLTKKIAHILRTTEFELAHILKCSIDARHKDRLMYIYSVAVRCKNEASVLKQNRNNNNVMLIKQKPYQFPHRNHSQHGPSPVIVGAGPAGYFCGLYLARNGYRPIIVERGRDVDTRRTDVERFWNGGEILPDSNVSFGEGGAGTFSDGKLNTGIKDPAGRIQAVIRDFLAFGAPEDIGYQSKPHIGTDELVHVMKRMREEIISLGGQVRFQSKFAGYELGKQGEISVRIESGEDVYTLNTNALVLAIGHSARDTFHMLHDKALPMEPKAFAIGVRIEHERALIDAAQYGTSPEASVLPAADYKMTYRSTGGRSVYSFCMCPGGFVVNASTDEGQAVVNGMSNHARDARNSNSAIVVNVTPEDFEADGFGKYGVLAGVEFQKKYEELAFKEGKGAIPAQRFDDYEAKRVSDSWGKVQPNIKGSYSFGDLNNCLPPYVNDAIIEGIHAYDEKLTGFSDSDTVLSGIESRTSSPVRILRNEEFMSSIRGIFPCGEGAGYAGGITSAAVDGIKVAEAVAGYIDNQVTGNRL